MTLGPGPHLDRHLPDHEARADRLLQRFYLGELLRVALREQGHRPVAERAHAAGRIGELLALEWDRLDFDEGELLINQALMKEDNEPTSVKSFAGQRTLVLSRGLLAAMEKKMEEDGDTRFVFQTTTGTPYHYDAVKKYWKDLLSVADVPHGGFHKCRHYYASRLIAAGVDPKVLTTNMGHADPAFTLRVYGHLFDDRDTKDRKRQVAEELSTLSL